MITMEFNKHSADDFKLIQELRRAGVSDETIQKSYDKTQKNRVNEQESKNTD